MNRAIDHLINFQLERMSWIGSSASKIPHWREEDRRNGVIWADEIQRDGDRANNASPVNK
jgi:hypothetical protein